MTVKNTDKKMMAINKGLMYLELQLDTMKFPFSSDCYGPERNNLQSPSNFPEFQYGDLHEIFNLYFFLLHSEKHLPSTFRTKLIKAIRPKKIASVNFFGDIDADCKRFPNDPETTAVCYTALLTTNTVTESELASISQSVYDNVNDDGVLQLYCVTKEHPRYNRLDPVCITNMVRFAYAQRHEHLVKRSEDYIFDWLNSGSYKSGTLYYPSPYTFLFVCSLLASTNYQTKARFMDTLRKEFNQINKDDLKYPLDYALVTVTGAKLGFYDENLIEKLVDMQNEDGSWPADAMYATNQIKIYFGSKSISTIVSVLALMETIH